MISLRTGVAIVAGLAVWISVDVYRPLDHDLRQFDPITVGRLEARLWHSYCDHERLKLFLDLTTLLRTQYGMPFWRSNLAAFQAARAALSFQNSDYPATIPPLRTFFALLQRSSSTQFRSDEAAALELEWWIVHRERGWRPAWELESALARLQAELYGLPASSFAEHARRRTEAMQVRDGGGDWARIEDLLVKSWTSLHQQVSR